MRMVKKKYFSLFFGDEKTVKVEKFFVQTREEKKKTFNFSCGI
jgi:hypothetical protein